MYGVGRKALPRSVKLWYYMRPFFLNSAVAAILRAVIRCRVHPELFSWEGARNVRALSVRFGSEGSILYIFRGPLFDGCSVESEGTFIRGLVAAFIIRPLPASFSRRGFGVLCFRRGTLKYIIAPHTLSEQDQAEGHDRHAAHHAVDRDVGFAVFAGGRQQFVD